MPERSELSVALASMPWATTTRPSLSLGLLAARARARGFACDVLYPNVFFSALVGAGGYEFLSNTPACFGLDEHVFATDVFGREALRSDEYLDTFDDGLLDAMTQAPGAPVRGTREILIDLRDRIVPAFLDTYAAEIAERRPDVVGFTCTFNQVMPSVALARRIKQIDPRITVVLGGPCVHGPMGVCYSRVFGDDIDAVFIGEADDLFPEFLRRVARGESLAGMPGLAIARRGSRCRAAVSRSRRARDAGLSRTTSSCAAISSTRASRSRRFIACRSKRRVAAGGGKSTTARSAD